MNTNFNYVYQQLTGNSVQGVLEKNPVSNEVDFMTRMIEDNHIVLLRSLLTELAKDSQEGRPPSCAHIFEKSQIDFNNLIIDFHKRLQEFEKLWVDRFSSQNMLPTLKKFDWIEFRDDKYFLSGEGNPGEAHNFYKFTVKDTVAEAVRILALFDGALGRLQEKISSRWHEEVLDNENKLIPLFESAMRAKEMNELKTIRRKLPDIFQKCFCEKVKDWHSKGYSSEEELYRKMASSWFKKYHNENGFEGFMVFVSEFMWEFIKVKVDLYENKWRILLRGVSAAQTATP